MRSIEIKSSAIAKLIKHFARSLQGLLTNDVSISEDLDTINTTEVLTPQVQLIDEEYNATPSVLHAPSASQLLAAKIQQIMQEQQPWRDASFTVNQLSKMVYSNKTYVTCCFRKQLHTTFSGYVNRCRIDYVLSCLHSNPSQPLELLFEEAGYQHYTTGWRNFKRFTGSSPTAYVANMLNIIHI